MLLTIFFYYLNKLISLLNEKGIFTKEEFQEMVKVVNREENGRRKG